VTLPRRLVPEQTHVVSRRTRGRCAFLRPDRKGRVNAIVLYALGVAQRRTPGVKLHAFVTEVTHHHSGLTDSKGVSQLPVFFRELHSLTARALNAHYGRGENLWSQPGSYDNVEVHGLRTLEEQLLYVWTQPVKDGLVARPEDWTGVLFLPEDLGRTFVVRKPEGAFFGGRRPEGHEPTYEPARREHARAQRAEREKRRREEAARDRARGRRTRRRRQLSAERGRRRNKERAPRPPRDRDTLPELVTVTISVPPGYEHLSLDEVRAHFRQLLDARIEAIHAQRRAEGRTRFMGIEAVLAQDPRASVGDTFPTFARNPRVACRDGRRVAILEGLVQWRLSYRAALERWQQGEREVVFPDGAYWLPHFHGAKSGPRAPPAA
jgi:hypothetical protein